MLYGIVTSVILVLALQFSLSDGLYAQHEKRSSSENGSNRHQDPEIDQPEQIKHPDWAIPRNVWMSANTSFDIADRFSPVMLVIIQHTVSPQCTTFLACAAQLRNLQSYFINDLGYDMPYNFIIGNDGRVYEGRGWNKEGAHTFGYNRCSLGIGFIGDYREEIPNHARVTDAQLSRTRELLNEGVRLGYLRHDHQVVGARNLQNTASPGSNLYNAIRNWNNFDHRNRFANKNCEQIQDQFGNVDLR